MSNPDSCIEGQHKAEQVGDSRLASSLDLVDNLALTIDSHSAHEDMTAQIQVRGALADRSPDWNKLDLQIEMQSFVGGSLGVPKTTETPGATACMSLETC
jgi:hypothetical protein